MALNPIYKMEPVPGAGLGMIATSTIQAGTLIIAESALFTVNGRHPTVKEGIAAIKAELRALGEEQQKIFYSLHNCYDKSWPLSYAILRTNAMPLGSDTNYCGIFPVCCRFNHSCTPNAQFSWNSTLRKEVIYAIDDILPGTQITVYYMTNQSQTRAARQENLYKDFHFHCNCDACSKPPGEIAFSDKRRRELGILSKLVETSDMYSNPTRGLRYCKRTLELLKEEGLFGGSMHVMYWQALAICVANGDMARASAFASLARDVMQLSQGKEATEIEETKLFIEHPEKHPMARRSYKWHTKTSSAPKAGSEGFEEWLWARAE